MNPQQPWQNNKQFKRMNYLRKSGLLSDCSFELTDTDDKKIVIKCHKCILICASPVFEVMFLGDFKEANNNKPIPIIDAPADAFEKFIDYLYCEADGPAIEQLDFETIKSLLHLSHKYMVSFMIDRCCKAMCDMVAKGLSPESIIELYKIANRIENTDLESTILITILTDPLVYINEPNLFNLSFEVFLKFIKEVTSDLSELVRFDVIENYCTINGLIDDKRTLEDNPSEKIRDEEKREEENEWKTNKLFVKELLKTINFRLMSTNEFCSGPHLSTMMTSEEKLNKLILMCQIESIERV